MQLEALAPQSGRTFSLRARGNHPPSKILLFGAVLFGLVFLWLLSLGTLPSPPRLSPQSAAEFQLILRRILTLGKVAFGILFGACLAGFLISRRSYELIIEGDSQGALLLEGTLVDGRRRMLRPEFGPYRLAVVRKVRDDLPAGGLDQSDLHLYAVAQEDDRADEALLAFLRTQILVIDKEDEPEVLLDAPELLPTGVEEVMNSLRTQCNGTLEKVRGGGFVLHVPPAGKQG